MGEAQVYQVAEKTHLEKNLVQNAMIHCRSWLKIIIQTH